MVDGKRATAIAVTSDKDQIASVNVLKGDAATTKYGSDGKNGVVEITTKAAAAPIYIIDGKRSTEAEMKKLGKEQIASVDVLKGETAIAKYGNDGKNGVIVITTKH